MRYIKNCKSSAAMSSGGVFYSSFDIAALIFFALISFRPSAFGADTVRLAFSSFSATNAGFLTAIDEKLFERRGIDLVHVYIASSSIVLPAVLTREVDFATLSGEAVVRAYYQ